MQAAIFRQSANDAEPYLSIEDVPRPSMLPGHSLLRMIACGVCRTDWHIVTGELPALRPELIPGHQIVGEIIDDATPNLPIGTRVGVSWMGGVDGKCWYCMHNAENLCDDPTFTGYTVDGGYAEFALVRTDFLLRLPVGIDDAAAAPLLCAGIIGFRSLRVAGVQPGERVGLYGFGSSASLAIQVLQSWKCEEYVSFRGQGNRDRAAALSATWVFMSTPASCSSLMACSA
jgi:propanol-preferring alcohol dehydrogenase